MASLIRILLFLAIAFPAFSQTVSSVNSGSWDDPLTWGGVVPTFSNSTSIRIQSGHIVNVPNGYSVQVDQLQIRLGGQLTIDAGGLMDIVNTSGNDLFIFTGAPNGQLVVNGTLEVSQGATIVNFDGVTSTNTTSSTVTFNNGSIYRHKYTTTAGTILGALWQTGSTVEITGYTSNASRPLNLNQAFHHFTWNCPSQAAVIDLKGNLSTVGGNLNILSTGGTSTGNLRLFYADNNITLTVGGDFTITGTSGVWFTGSGTGNIVNITGDLIINNNIQQLTAREGNITINCNDLNVLNTSILSLGSFASSFSIINLTGNFNIVGTLNGGSGNASVNFVGTTTQSILGNGSIGKINFTINSGAIVDVGTNSIRGTGSLTVNSGAELRVGDSHASGAIQNSTTAGNIRVPVNSRTYNTLATIVYSGAGSQFIGAGHPQANTTIRTNTTLLTNNLTITALSLENGALTAGNRTLNVRGNWNVNGGTFVPGTGGVIFNGVTNITGTGPFAFAAFNVSSTGSVSTGSASISVSANFTVNTGGVLNSGTSTITFTGGNTQTINVNGTTMNNITVNKSAGDVNVTSALPLAGVLSIQTATTFRTNGILTLLSTNDNPARDGSIAALPDLATIIGNVTIQRYMRTQDNVNRFVSTPISNATVAQLQDDFSITGSFTGTSFPCTGCNNNGASLKRYSEGLTGQFANGYAPVPADGGNNSEPLVPGVGYDTYMWNGVTPITWDVTGTINRGTINFTISHTPSTPAVPAADGWNLVGNPYPSAIQWNNGAGWSKTNVDPVAWVWDVVNRVWVTHNANTVVLPTQGIIAMGQAFWVYVPVAAPASMSINEQAKSTGGSGNYYRQAPLATLTVSLSKGEYADHAFLLLNDESTQGFDGGIDCPKLELGIERMHVSLVEDGNRLAYYGVQNKFDLDIPIHVSGEEEGRYELNFSNTGAFPDLEGYYLVDLVAQKSVKLTSSLKHSFIFKKDQPENRFLLTRNPLPENSANEVQVTVFPNPTSGQVSVHVEGSGVKAMTLINNTGVQLESVNSFEAIDGNIEHSFDLVNLPSGIYILKVITGNSIIVKRISKK